jgi:hypothetical protein
MDNMTAQIPDSPDFVLGVGEALDIIEGVVGGGLVGLGAYIVTGAVSTIPANFLSGIPHADAIISTITGALVFTAMVIRKMRIRHKVF